MDFEYNEKNWGILAMFVCAHQSDENIKCARPQFARARVGWTQGWFTYTASKLDTGSKFWAIIFNMLPIVFGPAVVICATCKNVVFLRRQSGVLYKLFNAVGSQEDHSMQFSVFPDDMCNFTPETQKNFMVDPLTKE